MRRPGMLAVRLGLAASLSVALLAGASEAEAKKVIVRKPRPMPTPPPPQAEREPPRGVEGGVPGGVVGGVVGGQPEGSGRPSLVEATATVWAQAGSRSWTGCSKVASEASKQMLGFFEEVNSFRENHHWAIQAGECPNAPEVLTMATRAELLRRFDLPEGLDDKTDLSPIETQLADSRARALAWIAAAQAELDRRRDPRGLGLEYWRARALLSTSQVDEAIAAFERGLTEATVEGWKLRRLLALAELYSGDLEAALAQANRAGVDAPYSERLVSFYVLALVLDRAGDPAGAERRMKMALDMDGDGSQMRALESALPIHERLYLRALAKTVRREAAGALRLWDAYLARPEPEAPERRLAERHRSALEPLPANLGGLPRADEGQAASAGKPGTGGRTP